MGLVCSFSFSWQTLILFLCGPSSLLVTKIKQKSIRPCPPRACNLMQVVHSWAAGSVWILLKLILLKSFAKQVLVFVLFCCFLCFVFVFLFVFLKDSPWLSSGSLVGLCSRGMKKHFSRRANISIMPGTLCELKAKILLIEWITNLQECSDSYNRIKSWLLWRSTHRVTWLGMPPRLTCVSPPGGG